MRELNRLGLTSAIDAGGGFQNYPEDYEVIAELHEKKQMTIRIAYNLFTQRPGHELEDFEKWTDMLTPGQGSDFFRHNGAGEMLVFSAADFEDFLEPRPDLAPGMEDELERVVRHLVEHRWPFRLHATYNESISRMLDVFEKVNRDIPFNGLHWFFDHAETVSQANIDRIKALGGGIAVQHRMAFQGEYFAERYGIEATRHTPPVAKMLETGVPVGLGTDATRVASYNPWTALYWLVSGRTVGGMQMYDHSARLDRDTALMLWTQGSAWFSSEQNQKGQIKAGQLADLAVLSKDYFRVPEEEIKGIESVLTVVNGDIVYAAGAFGPLAPPAIPVLPEWSPVVKVPGHYRSAPPQAARVGMRVAHYNQEYPYIFINGARDSTSQAMVILSALNHSDSTTEKNNKMKILSYYLDFWATARTLEGKANTYDNVRDLMFNLCLELRGKNYAQIRQLLLTKINDIEEIIPRIVEVDFESIKRQELLII